MTIDSLELLSQLRRQFAEQLPERLAAIHKEIVLLTPEAWSREAAEHIHQQLLNLAGSAATFGLFALRNAVEPLEQRMTQILANDHAPALSEWGEVSALLEQLLTQDLSEQVTEASEPFLARMGAPLRPVAAQSVFLLEERPEQPQLLGDALSARGYRPQFFTTIEALQEALAAGERPGAIVLELCQPSGRHAGAELVSRVRASYHDCPPVILAGAEDDLAMRLAAYRAGAVRYFPSPIQPHKLIALLEDVVGEGQQEPYRVLLLDDDPVALQAQATALSQARMTVETLSEPLRLFEAVERFHPEMLVLDVYMPGASGPELAAVLREDERYRHLPILFLSCENDISKQLLALNLGGDDFLVKPVAPAHLVAAVNARVRRARLEREMMARIEFSLYERDQEHRALNDHAIVSVTDTTGRITYVNDRFCEVSGYSRDELIGHNHRIIKSGQHPPEFFRELWRTIAQGKVWHGEVSNRRKDGSLYWVESTVTPFLDARGRPYQYVSIRTDITKIKAHEQALASLVEGTARVSGQAFFERAAEGLAKALGMRIGFIAEKASAHSTLINTIALWHRDRIEKNFSYFLDNAPSIEKGLTVYPEKVTARFPGFAWMREHKIESYIALPLHDSEGRLLGVMGAMDTRPLDEAESKIDLLQIFAARAAGEMERVRIEQEAAIHEERLRRGQLYANIGTWDWDIQNGELFWTERIAPLFGYPEGQLATSYENFMAAVHPDDRQAVANAVNACVEHDVPYDIEHRVVWPDGTTRWLLERGAVVRDELGRPLHMLGVVMDIHERKMAELAQRESDEKFRKLFEMSPLGIALNSLDGSFLDGNQALLDAVGYTLDEFRALTYWQLTPEEYAEQEEQQLESLRLHGRYGPFEKEYIHKDGHRVPVLLSGSLVTDKYGTKRIWSIVQDITERKRAEQELLIFKRVFDSTEQGIGVTDAQGKILYSNSAHDHIHGYSHEEVIGSYFTKFFSEETLSWAADKIMGAVQSGQGWSGLLPVRHPDGSEVMTAANVGFISGNDGKPQYLFNLMSDYTPELNRQQQLAEAKESAERANQAKSEFLSSMSHELRTPMNAILGFAQILEFDEQLNPEQQDSINEILKAGHHLLDLINEVLDLAKIESGRIELSLEPVVLSEVIEECLALVQPLADVRGITLHRASVKGFMMRADRVRLKQVLLNLLSNAIKYNRENGTVSISLKEVEEKQLRLTVTDSGPGIAKAKLEELFQPFNRLDAEYSGVEGTGIGLTITRQLVELMGGRINVESTLGVGSAFWFELPDERGDGEGNLAEFSQQQTAEWPGGAGKTVLYIEDNPSNLKLVSQLISRYPHIHLITAHTSELGIELAMAHLPHLILLDINMPGMEGWQVLRVFRSSSDLKQIPVIAVTANAMTRDIERGKAAGFADYITKPIDARRFLETIEHWLCKSQPNLPQD